MAATLLGRHAPQTELPAASEVAGLQPHAVGAGASQRRAGGRLTPPDRGKTEAWVVLAAEPGSKIYAGLKPGVTRDDLARGARRRRVRVAAPRVRAGRGRLRVHSRGTVHALGAGLVIAEIQQASDTTFRLFDWNRVDAAGKPRPLHVAAVAGDDRLRARPGGAAASAATGVAGRERLVECDKFVLDRVTLDGADGDRRRRPLPCAGRGRRRRRCDRRSRWHAASTRRHGPATRRRGGDRSLRRRAGRPCLIFICRSFATPAVVTRLSPAWGDAYNPRPMSLRPCLAQSLALVAAALSLVGVLADHSLAAACSIRDQRRCSGTTRSLRSLSAADMGPEIVGGRPLDYQVPVPEVDARTAVRRGTAVAALDCRRGLRCSCQRARRTATPIPAGPTYGNPFPSGPVHAVPATTIPLRPRTRAATFDAAASRIPVLSQYGRRPLGPLRTAG